MTSPRFAKWIGWAIAFGFFAYSAVLLFYPCILVADSVEEPIYLSRIDHALILLQNVEVIPLQWTNGSNPFYFSDRLSILARAIISVFVLTAIGTGVVRTPVLRERDRTSPFMNRVPSLVLGVAMGYFWLALCFQSIRCVAFLGLFPAGLSLQCWTSIVAALVTAWTFQPAIRRALKWLRDRHSNANDTPKPSLMPHKSGSATEIEEAPLTSWDRRLIGLSVVGLSVVIVMSILTALQPSSDLDVRKTNWAYWVEQARASSDRTSSNRSSAKSFENSSIDSSSLAAVIYHWEPITPFWIAMIGRSESVPAPPGDAIQTSALDSKPSPLSEEVQQRYIAFNVAKLIATLVYWSSLLTLAGSQLGTRGILATTLGMAVFAANPASLELLSLFRMEAMIAAAIALLIVMTRDRNAPSARIVPAAISLTPLLMFWVISWWVDTPHEIERMELLGRVLGFSTYLAIPVLPAIIAWIVANAWVHRSVMSRFTSLKYSVTKDQLAIGIYLVSVLMIGFLLRRSDRNWVALAPLLISPMVAGLQSLRPHYKGVVWFASGVVFLSVAAINAAGWPFLDIRWFTERESLLRERHQAVSVSGEDSKRPSYVGELSRLLRDGTLPERAPIIVLGTWDTLDLPRNFRSVSEGEFSDMISAESPDAMIETLAQAKFFALVENTDSTSDLDRTFQLRKTLNRLEKGGRLERIEVSTENRDLQLFVVK